MHDSEIEREEEENGAERWRRGSRLEPNRIPIVHLNLRRLREGSTVLNIRSGSCGVVTEVIRIQCTVAYVSVKYLNERGNLVKARWHTRNIRVLVR